MLYNDSFHGSRKGIFSGKSVIFPLVLLKTYIVGAR